MSILKGSLERRVKRVGGTLQGLLEAADEAQQQAFELRMEILDEKARLEAVEVNLDRIETLAGNLVRLSFPEEG